MESSKLSDLNQKIHIGMMEVIDELIPEMDKTIRTIANFEFPQSSVSAISQTNQSYVSLSDKTDVEVNLVENEGSRMAEW